MTDDDSLAPLVDILARQSDHPIDRDDLLTRITDLLSATGRLVQGEEAIVWAELDADREPHTDTARLFTAIAEADDPLAAARIAPSLIRQRVFGRLEGWWRRQLQRTGYQGLPADLRDVTWEALPARDRSRWSPKDDIRAAIRDLAAYEASQVPRGRPFKGDHEAALWSLADIFIDFTGSDRHPLDLPHEPGSRFIQFAHLALKPHFGATEVSADALAGRWRRAKEHARSSLT